MTGAKVHCHVDQIESTALLLLALQYILDSAQNISFEINDEEVSKIGKLRIL